MQNVAKLLSVALTALAIGCNDARETLHVYNWADYVDQELVSQFEKENNCRVVTDQFDDNEAMLAKILAGATGYDIVFPSSYIVETMVEHGLVAELDKSLIPNVMANFDEKYKKFLLDDSFRWSVPYAFSVTGLVYKKDRPPTKFQPDTWEMVFDPAFTGRICLLDDMREIIGIGLKLNGFSVNSTNESEIAKAVDTMVAYKRRAKKLDSTQYRTGIVSDEFYCAMGYNSDAMQVLAEDEDSTVTFFVPKEGTTCCFDEMVIMKNSKKKELAHKYIDFFYRPEVAAVNARYIQTNVPNKGMLAHFDVEELAAFEIPEDVLKRAELLKNIGPAIDLYNKAWDKFKATR